MREKETKVEYDVINISSIKDLAKYKMLSEDSEFDPTNVRFKIQKQLIKEQVYETSSNKRRIEGELLNGRHQIMLLLKKFYENLDDLKNIGNDDELKTMEDLDLLEENDLYIKEPLEKVINISEIELIDIFKNYMIEYIESRKLNSDVYDE